VNTDQQHATPTQCLLLPPLPVSLLPRPPILLQLSATTSTLVQHIPVSPMLANDQPRSPQSTVSPKYPYITCPPTPPPPSPPPPHPPTYPSLSCTLSESEFLNVEDLYTERRDILEWLLASVSNHRSAYTLSTLHSPHRYPSLGSRITTFTHQLPC
jgi:hypothetical protein